MIMKSTYENKQIEIDFRDMVKYIFQKWKILILILMAVGMSIVLVELGSSKNDTNMSNSVETGVSAEDTYYNDLLSEQKSIKTQIANNAEYVSNSLLMQIDPNAVHYTDIVFLLNISNENCSKAAALITAYENNIKNGNQLSKIAESENLKKEWLYELISISDSSAMNTNENVQELDKIQLLLNKVKNSDEINSYLIVVHVVSPNDKLTKKIVDTISMQIQSTYDTYSKLITPHTLKKIDEYSGTYVDNDIRSQQHSIQDQMATLETGLSNCETAITVYSGLNNTKQNYDMGSNNIVKVIQKAIYGEIGTVCILIICISFWYVIKPTFSTASQFSSRFGITILGDKMVDSAEMISINIRNVTKNQKKILMSGTIEKSSMVSIFNELDVEENRFEVETDIINDPVTRGALCKADGIILIEKKNHSRYEDIKREIDIIEQAHKEILGIILV